MTPTGFEALSTTTYPGGALRQAPFSGAAKSGAILPENALADHRLFRLVTVWPDLPEDARQAILELVSKAIIK
jgi:hypothetical protein